MSSQLLPCRPMSQRICSRPSVGRKMMRGNTWGPFLLLKAVTLMVLSAPSVALLAGDNDGQGENILVPGLAHTNSGYDNIGGEDAICWSSTAANGHENETSQVDGGEHDLHDGRSFQWNSPLQPNFVSGHTAMLSKCPGETSMHIEMNHHDDPDFRYANIHEGTAMETHLMRAKQTYSYHIVAHVDVGAIREIYHLADDAFFQSLVCKDVAFRLIFCPVNGNLCSPFFSFSDAGNVTGKVSEGDTNGVHLDHDEEPMEEPVDREGDDNDHDHLRRRSRYMKQKHHDGHSPEHDKGSSSHLEELYSPIFFFPFEFSLNQTVLYFDLTVKIEIPRAGSYIPLATMHFFMDNGTLSEGLDSDNDTIASTKPEDTERRTDAYLKFDMANLLQERAVVFYDPVDIRVVTPGALAFSYVIIAVSALIQIVLMGLTLRHRENGVMKMAQGGFLVLLLVAGVIASTCSVLYNPVSELTCYLRGPLTQIPLQFMLAVIYGRLRRINSLMQPLMMWLSPESVSWGSHGPVHQWLTNVWQYFRCHWSSPGAGDSGSTQSERERRCAADPFAEACTSASANSTKSSHRRPSIALRQTFTATRLWGIIVLATLPMVIFVVVGMTVFSPEYDLTVNNEQTVGTYTCRSSDKGGVFAMVSASVVLLVTVLVAMYEAFRSRRLPGMFNEAGSVLTALLMSVCVILFAIPVVLLTQNNVESPDVSYLMEVILICLLSNILSIKLVLPKLRLIWSGEKVVISKILSDHSKLMRRKSASNIIWNGASGDSSRFSSDQGFVSGEITIGPLNTQPTPERDPISPSDHADMRESVSDDTRPNDNDSVGTISTASREAEAKKIVSLTDSGLENELEQVCLKESQHTPDRQEQVAGRCGRTIRVLEGRSPPSKLIVPILDLSKLSSRISERMMSGLQVHQEDWEQINKSVHEFHELLNSVKYHSENVSPEDGQPLSGRGA